MSTFFRYDCSASLIDSACQNMAQKLTFSGSAPLSDKCQKWREVHVMQLYVEGTISRKNDLYFLFTGKINHTIYIQFKHDAEVLDS